MTEEKNAYVEARPTQFLPKLKGEKAVIRLASGGQPATGIIEIYNPSESLHQTTKGQILVFKHAIATIEAVNEPKGLQDNRGEFKADEEIFSKSS